MRKRRIVPARDSVVEAIKERKQRMAEPQKAPTEHKPLTELAQLERQLYLANLALNKYQTKLEGGIELTPEEERLFLAHQDSIRKLETTLSALRSKKDYAGLSSVKLACEMVASGIPREEVLALYPDNEKVKEALCE